jgi:hypothetical protein
MQRFFLGIALLACIVCFLPGCSSCDALHHQSMVFSGADVVPKGADVPTAPVPPLE